MTALIFDVCAFTTFDSMNLIFSFALKGAGDTRFVSLVALMLPWPIADSAGQSWMREWEGAVFWAGRGERLRHNASASILSPVSGGKWKSMSVIGSLDPKAALATVGGCLVSRQSA